LNHASFCGLIFDMKNNRIITNPTKVILKTPWCSRKYVQSGKKVQLDLLKSRALSLLWTYPGCPVIQNYAKYLLRMTSDVKATFRENVIGSFNYIQLTDINSKSFENQLYATPYTDIELTTRQLMCDVFGYTIPEQLALEKIFDEKNDLDPFYNEILLSKVDDCDKHCFEKYTIKAPAFIPFKQFKYYETNIFTPCPTNVLKLIAIGCAATMEIQPYENLTNSASSMLSTLPLDDEKIILDIADANRTYFTISNQKTLLLVHALYKQEKANYKARASWKTTTQTGGY
jgi:hypothetical protein